MNSTDLQLDADEMTRVLGAVPEVTLRAKLRKLDDAQTQAVAHALRDLG